MKKHFVFFISLLLLNYLNAQAQNTGQSYDRIALTVVYVDDPNPNVGITRSIRQSAVNFYSTSSVVPDKYDDHFVPTRVINIDLPNFSYENPNMSEISTAINQAKIPSQMVERWFNRTSSGVFNMDLIKERGRYNATDNDYLTSTANQRQNAVLEDMGEKLLQKSYLLLINLTEVEALKNSSNKLYYTGSAKAFLYRLVWDEATSSSFYNEFWINEADNETLKAEKREKFKNGNFNVEYVNTLNVNKNQALDFSLSLFNDAEKLTYLLANLSQGIIDKLVTVSKDFNIKNNLISSKPIAATIGTKEGLYIDQRFNVMETRTDSKNNLFDKRKAVVRVKKVSDNKFVTQGKTNPSIFYQVAGGKIDHFGMFLKENKDFGLSFSATKLFGGVGGTDFSGTYNISRAISKNLKINVPTGLHLYGEIGFDSKNYEDVAYDGSYNYDFNRFSFGLIKDFYFGNFFHNSYKAGYGFESTELTGNELVEDQVRLNGKFVLVGTRLGLNIFHNIQLISGINYYIPFGNATLKYGNDAPIEDAHEFTYYFEDRKGLSLYAGVKIII